MEHQKQKNVEIHNNLKGIMAERQISISKLSEYSEVSRGTISRIYNNSRANITSDVSFALSGVLNVKCDELLSKVYKLIISDDPNGFTNENISILDSKIKACNLPSLKYEVYSGNRSMNFQMQYSSNRRFYLSGNMRFEFISIPKLTIINFGLIKNRPFIDLENYVFIFSKYLECFLEYSKKIRIGIIEMRLVMSETYNETGDIEIDIMKKLGFRYDTDKYNSRLYQNMIVNLFKQSD
ncbi:helix-turn-helix domain-containing protein [Companilactobacillus keshanensis]|uniref:Helix-turn-helix domain-containing protein n=1 Tax=Companilactobacillus keshanensis TaxID=2486003 RepID=A0ABW4BUJ3_9LACO|nr:helix-turn-helix transcriptional regulator [Companilactobacillus keshanensis]